MKLKVGLSVILGVILGTIIGLWSKPPSTKVEIPAFANQNNVLSSESSPRQVIGFLPYWNLGNINDFSYDKLTTIHYFALDIDGEGNINKDDGGWQKFKSDDYENFRTKMASYPIRAGVTFVSLKADDIARVVNNKTRQKKLIDNILKIMKDQDFVDLNFDFEYVGDLDSTTIKNYTSLVENIVTQIHEKIPGSVVSIDVYADSVAKKRIFDIPALAKIVDQIIIMGYDFNRLGSVKAGPVAPLFGKEKYEYEIYQSVVDFLESVPPEKLVLAVPFYGYEWPVTDPQPNSFVIPSSKQPQMASYKRAMSLAKDNHININFDDESKSAWFSYFDKDSKTYRQIWFENERSLGLKFDLVNQANLTGIGIWALGYDGPGSALLWQTVAEKLR